MSEHPFPWEPSMYGVLILDRDHKHMSLDVACLAANAEHERAERLEETLRMVGVERDELREVRDRYGEVIHKVVDDLRREGRIGWADEIITALSEGGGE